MSFLVWNATHGGILIEENQLKRKNSIVKCIMYKKDSGTIDYLL